jgi:Ca2+-binding RTX toxin-like protein
LISILKFAASRGTLSGREDFSFTANGGAGNDSITVSVQIPLGSPNWYLDQKANANLFINGGEGNDTIKSPSVW